MQSGKFIVGSLDKSTGRFSASASPKEHHSEAAAKAEAARLAQSDSAKDFVVLEVKAISAVQNITWR